MIISCSGGLCQSRTNRRTAGGCGGRGLTGPHAPAVLMPRGASAAGEAFELLSSMYLAEKVGLRHAASPFYTRLSRGKWVQFDGLFTRADGSRLVLEAKFCRGPIGLTTPGIAARINFTKELAADGIVLASRRGFGRDIMRLRLPVEKVLLSWPGMRKGLAEARAGGLLTAALDVVNPVAGGLRAASGAVLKAGGTDEGSVSADGFVFAPPDVERWVRRLPASPRDIDVCAPPAPRTFSGGLSIETAWAIEDSLRGFAPASPELLVMLLGTLAAGPLRFDDIRRRTWRCGYRGGKGGLRNALKDLCVVGAAERFKTARGNFYGLVPGGPADAAGRLERALERWPAWIYFRRRAAGADKYRIAADLSSAFCGFYPYARSLYNPAKVAGLLALRRYFAPSDSTTRPS